MIGENDQHSGLQTVAAGVTNSRRALAALVAVTTLLWATRPGHAVIISADDGTANTTAPMDDPGWAHVGRYGDFTAVYLGNRWALAADHVPTASEIVFEEQTIPVQPGLEVTLRNPNLADLPPDRQDSVQVPLTEFTDLRLVRLAVDPGLPPLTIAPEAPPFVDFTTDVVMIGNGRNRAEEKTVWNVIDLGGGDNLWEEIPPDQQDLFPRTAEGFHYAPGQTKRWGTNSIVADGLAQIEDQDVLSLITQFSRESEPTETEFESQAARGDSGGGVFYKNGDQWELAGTMLLVRPAAGQPDDTAVFGNLTIMADLSIYRAQIEEIITRTILEAGDANQDLEFNQFDIITVLQRGKYLSDAPATWGEGDWNGAPGGTVGSPPQGDGSFDQFDIVAALQAGTYLTGPFAAVVASPDQGSERSEPLGTIAADVANSPGVIGWNDRMGDELALGSTLDAADLWRLDGDPTGPLRAALQTSQVSPRDVVENAGYNQGIVQVPEPLSVVLILLGIVAAAPLWRRSR